MEEVGDTGLVRAESDSPENVAVDFPKRWRKWLANFVGKDSGVCYNISC